MWHPNGNSLSLLNQQGRIIKGKLCVQVGKVLHLLVNKIRDEQTKGRADKRLVWLDRWNDGRMELRIDWQTDGLTHGWLVSLGRRDWKRKRLEEEICDQSSVIKDRDQRQMIDKARILPQAHVWKIYDPVLCLLLLNCQGQDSGNEYRIAHIIS